MKLTHLGIDIAGNVMEMHYVDEGTGGVVNKSIKRALSLEYCANRAPCLIRKETCGGAHHWARQLTKMGSTGEAGAGGIRESVQHSQ